MSDNVTLPGTGVVVGTESATINSVAVEVQQVKPVFGARDAYTGSQGGRLVDGATDTAAGFSDPRPNTKEVSATPTVTNGAYAAGNCLGTVIDFGAIARVSGGGLYIVGATLAETASQQDAPIDLLLFNANPSNGTYTDKSAPSPNATDTKMVRGVINFGAYTNLSTTESVCYVPCGITVVLDGTQHLYGLMITRGTPTPGSTTAYTLTLDYIAD